MEKVNWLEEVEKRKTELIEDTQKLLQIKSVLDEEAVSVEAPLGEGIKEALDFMLNLGEKDGFTVMNTDNLAGHIEMGEGKELVGILCHVDVVPEGDGWTSDPYSAEIRDGKIFARGALDDKGPTMAAYYGMKLISELGLPLKKRVRMIIGTDEESNWRCVSRYFETEEMPGLGFAPDADFPIIFAEKGISDFDLVQNETPAEEDGQPQVEVLQFQSGRRYNMVPDYAKAEVLLHNGETEIMQKFLDCMDQHGLEKDVHVDAGITVFEVKGVSAHGMEPEHGKSAGLYLAEFISTLETDQKAKNYFRFAARYFFKDSRGNSLGIAYRDDIAGDLTINVGRLSYSKEHGGLLGLNLRYPVTATIDEIKMKLEPVLKENGFHIGKFTNSNPHHVDESDFLIQTLKKVYEEQTGDKAELLAIGGGTYARSLKSGVAFGPLFPGRPDVAHQKDEYMYIEDLLKAAAIYAQAIYELAKED
ncbi:dipeptidase PepV [Neobacillus notoginsengisoli]|uniref:Dipeptidase PepV n=1 Tax=Neobacillus notoginsengisoli TaxID=1578198 RepID=A0A417YUD4_9BACI|nr:dipeptidase PepV [Neobacillus notoginsengisoli]RHW40796.1 dipeptidase PepV [Neobacillus notoginsengisoli]